MKKLTGLLLLWALLSSLAGCHNWRHVQNNDGKVPNWNPTAADLVHYLNENAGRVQALQCNYVQCDAKQGIAGGIGIDGTLVFEKPRNLRFKGKVLGSDGVDLGSNSEEFWYWISKAPEPYVFHCDYDALAKGNVPLQFPFQPDFLIAALGVQEYDPQGKYEVKTNRDTVELIEATTSPAGQPMQKVVVFNRAEMLPPKPQVQSLILRDMQGKDILVVQYLETQTVGKNPCVVPQRMKILLPQEKERPELLMRLRDVRSVQLAPNDSANIFSRATLMRNRRGFDLARQQPDSAVGNSGLRPVGDTQLPPR